MVEKNTKQDFNNLYLNVANSIEIALSNIKELDVKHKNGQQEISGIVEKLNKIHDNFNNELQLLEENAEWDKFTIAFFGETNAGKSTIIESLRILFNENSRQELLEKNANDIVKYEQELIENINFVQKALYSVYAEYTEQLDNLRESTSILIQIVQNESSVRIKTKQWICTIFGILLGSVITAGLIIFFQG